MMRIHDTPRRIPPTLFPALFFVTLLSLTVLPAAGQGPEGTLHTPFPGTPLSPAAEAAVEAALALRSRDWPLAQPATPPPPW